jgi:hypothetical protein
MACTDTALYPQLVKLLGCIDAKMDECEIELCYLGIPSGVTVDLSPVSASGSMAWVRVVTLFPVTLPELQRCNIQIQAQISVGFATCYSINEDGTPLSAEQDMVLSEHVMSLQSALLNAITCCDWPTSRRAVSVGSYEPIGPTGGAVGGSWNVGIEY